MVKGSKFETTKGTFEVDGIWLLGRESHEVDYFNTKDPEKTIRSVMYKDITKAIDEGKVKIHGNAPTIT